MPLRTGEIAAIIGGELLGEEDLLINSVSSPSAAGPDQLAFVADERHAIEAKATGAGCLIVPPGFGSEFACPAIEVADPKYGFAKAAGALNLRDEKDPGIHPTAFIDKNARIADGVSIGAHCVVGKGSVIGPDTRLSAGVKLGDRVRIGSECTIYPNAVIDDGAEIGDRVILRAGAVVGSAGFGFVRNGKDMIPFPQVGKVFLEDDVEIGANSCVDRGALGETRIGAGTKIDNLVQIAHNVSIGKRVVIAALSGVSGSVSIGDDCVIGGQVGVADHVTIDDTVVIGAKSAVFPGKRLRRGVWAGIPVQQIADYKRAHAFVKDLPRLRAKVRSLTEVVERLESLIAENS